MTRIMGAFFTYLRVTLFNDGFIRALPLLTLLLGLGGFVATYALFPASDWPLTHDAMKSLSQIVLGSGIVSVLLNSFKYMGIFKDAVHDVLFSTEHLKPRTDLPKLWSRITSTICQEKFPQLAERLHADVLAHYLPAEKNFFYSSYNRECEIRVDGADKDIVEIHEELDFYLHPANPSAEIVYSYRSATDSRTAADIARLDLHRLRIDGVGQQVKLIEEEYDDEFGGKGLRQSYVIPLKGRESYRIQRSATRRLRISRDPVIEYSSNEFILGCTVKFRCSDPSIVPVFQSVGTEEFDDRTMGPSGAWQIHREFSGLMFPRQGYILFIQRAVDTGIPSPRLTKPARATT